jgi:NADH-quinone oxidoreductase subunit M
VIVPWLSVLVALPVLGAVVVLLVPRSNPRLAKTVAVGVSLIELVLTIVVALLWSSTGSRWQLSESYSWVPAFGLHWALGLDGIALALIALTAVITPVVLAAGWSEGDRPALSAAESAEGGQQVRSAGYPALVLLTQGMLVGAFAATDVLLFYILFEAMLIPMYILIGVYGGPRRAAAATKFLVYNLLGGLVMLAGVIGLSVTSRTTAHPEGTFLLSDLQHVTIPHSTQYLIFIAFMIAFAIKAPLWPFHTWLPDAVEQTPPAGAAYLSGVVDKIGTFGMIHLAVPLFPVAARKLAPVIIVLAVISIIYGAILAAAQKDMQRFVAATSISHFGFIVLGIFALTSQGETGATLYMVNHGLSTVLLFLVVGFIEKRRGSRDWRDFGGLQAPAPALSGVFLVAALASLSLPGLATFVSEFLVLVGTFTRYPAAAVIATVGIVLAALYALLMYQRVMTGPTVRPLVGARDLRGYEALVVAPLIALLVVLGFYPKPLTSVINHGVVPTLSQAGVTDPKTKVPLAGASDFGWYAYSPITGPVTVSQFSGSSGTATQSKGTK